MQFKNIFLTAALALNLSGFTILRADQTEPPLHIAMKTMNAQLKAIRSSLLSSTDPATFPALVDMTILAEKAATDALFLEPHMATTRPADEKDALIVDFKKTIAQLLVSWIDLEIALRNKDVTAITAAVDLLLENKKAGHDRFIPPEP